MTWVKEVNNSTPQLTTYNAGLQVVVNGSVISATETRSDIINGWQRIELQFNIDVALPDGTPVEIQLIPSDRPLVISYFDDIRVHPYDSEMEAQVIDAVQQRPMATLDNRNFATVYQYDEEGNLVRTIQETERGKQTISENRTGVRIYK